MDLKYVRSELQKLSEIINSWNTPQQVPALERDLTLEKLRKLYDAIRFAPAADFAADGGIAAGDAAQEPVPTEIPINIDLGEILSLDPLPDAESSQPEFVSEPETGASFESAEPMVPEFGSSSDFAAEPRPEMEAVTAMAPEVEPDAVPESVEEPESAVTFVAEPAAETGAVADSAEEFVAAADADEPAGEQLAPATDVAGESDITASENTAESAGEQIAPALEVTSESEKLNTVASAAEQIAPNQETTDQSSESSESVAESTVESASKTAPGTDAEQAPAQKAAVKGEPRAAQPIAPTLFELEDETVRHRHKQRVIMSLYNTEPPAAPAPKPAPVPKSDPRPASKPASADKPAAKPAFAKPSVSDPAAAGISASIERAESYSPAAETASTVAKPVAAVAEPVPSAVEPASVPDPVSAATDPVSPVAGAFSPAAEPIISETEPIASMTEPVAYAAESAVSATGPKPSAEQTAFAAPQPQTAGASGSDDGDDEPDFEEITLESKNPSGAVLGDVINHDVQTLADTIAPPRDVASELRRSEPVTDLRRAIGINDKFLMIRDLFGGDAASYEAAIGALNDFDDFDECMIHIAENYAWNANSDGAKFLMELLERKFA